MKISIIGTRGIPAKYGGFETFAEEISSLLVRDGYEISVQCDKDSYNQNKYRGVNLFFSSVAKSDNQLKYYYDGMRWSIKNSDVILAASGAGSFLYFLNLLRRIPIITNPDGLEYKRKKWTLPKKIYLKLSEALAVRLSDYLIADSEEIRRHLCRSYRSAEKKIRVIEYGSVVNTGINDIVLEKYNLVHNNYYLVVCRLEPENNIQMITDGFKNAKTRAPLIIIGKIIDNQYVTNLIKKINSEKIRFLGGIYDRNDLNPLRYSCKAYLHGHSVGGTNPSLLEAMGSRNIILAHDNEFNREVTEGKQFYFKSADEVTEGIEQIESLTEDQAEKYKELSISRIIERYNWEIILRKYEDLFKEIKIRHYSDSPGNNI